MGFYWHSLSTKERVWQWMPLSPLDLESQYSRLKWQSHILQRLRGWSPEWKIPFPLLGFQSAFDWLYYIRYGEHTACCAQHIVSPTSNYLIRGREHCLYSFNDPFYKSFVTTSKIISMPFLTSWGPNNLFDFKQMTNSWIFCWVVWPTYTSRINLHIG